MPYTATSGQKAALAEPTTRLTWLCKLTRQDGAVYGFTTHDKALTFESVVYSPYGLIVSAIESSLEWAADTCELTLPLVEDSADGFTVDDIDAGRWDGCAVRLYVLIDWSDLDLGALAVFRGYLGGIQRSRTVVVCPCNSLKIKLDVVVGRTYAKVCNVNRFGDTRCGFDLATVTVTGTVESSASARSFVDSALIGDTGPYGHGECLFTDGDNADLVGDVKSVDSVTGLVTLHLPMPFAIQVGGGYALTQGCNRSFARCDALANTANFRGFKDMPGTRAVNQKAGDE